MTPGITRVAAIVATALCLVMWAFAAYLSVGVFGYLTQPPGHNPVVRALDLLLPIPALVTSAGLTVPALWRRRDWPALRWANVSLVGWLLFFFIEVIVQIH